MIITGVMRGYGDLTLETMKREQTWRKHIPVEILLYMLLSQTATVILNGSWMSLWESGLA